jgi:Ca-activated chloride channel family protein
MSPLMTGVEWREPMWLWLALFPWALLLVRQLLAGSMSKDYAEHKLLPWALSARGLSVKHHAVWQQFLLGFAWLLLAMAAAGPRVAQTVYDTDQSHYGQLIVLVDVSRSMTADDVSPSRLQRARLELLDLVSRIDQSRVGLVVYAARPHLLSPPTADKSLLQFYLQQLRYGLLPTHGSDLRTALEFAGSQFGRSSAAKSILIVSDGEISSVNANEDRALDEAVTSLRQQNISVFALGVGTRKGAAIFADDGSWLAYEGTEVVSRLQADRLERISTIGGGDYSEIRANDSEWRILYDQGIANQQTRSAIARGTGWIIWQEFYSWFLVPGVMLWLAAYLRPRAREHNISLMIMFVLAGTALTHNTDVFAADLTASQRAVAAYQQEAYQDARQWYVRVPGYDGRMGEGSSNYRLGKYDLAVRQFVRATLEANSDSQRADALFNLANSYFKLSRYRQAAEIYTDALRYRPQDKHISRNLAYAQALIKKEQAGGAATGRPGTGPRSATPPDGTDISDAGILLDTETGAKRAPAPPVGKIAGHPDSDLVRSGIRRAELAATDIEQSDDPVWTYDITSTDGVALKAAEIQIDESILWQRILEYEEEFPVLVETPYELPGVQPW